MAFTDAKNNRNCTEVVRKELLKNNVTVNDEILIKITLDIMNIFYSKGGDYPNKIIQSFAETYVEVGFYKKFIK